MTGIEPFGNLRVLKLSEREYRLVGTVDETGSAVDRLRQTRGVVSASGSVPTGVPGEVMMTVKVLPLVQRQAPAARTRMHPGWIIGILLSAALLVVVVGLVAVEVLPVLLPALVIIAVIAGLVGAGRRKQGGVHITQSVNIRK